MKKSLLGVVLAVVMTFAFATAAYATSAKTWNYSSDYYTWGSYPGNGAVAATNTLGQLGDNPTNPGVHGGYMATTAKCGICHSVHRAKATGVKLLPTATATCAGCHRAGATTVTNVLVSWQTGGPHRSGDDASCNYRGCHINNPHGANGSKYKLFANRLIKSQVDTAVADAVANPTASGISEADLNADASSTWTAKTRSSVVIGYTCNTGGCHTQTMLTVLKKGWAEQRNANYPLVDGDTIAKTGHLVSAEASSTHGSYSAVDGCTGCHDQTDAGTRTGFTFPHSQTAYGASNVTTENSGVARAYLWMTVASSATATDRVGMSTTTMKALDGACLKCHRDGAGNGIGLTQ